MSRRPGCCTTRWLGRQALSRCQNTSYALGITLCTLPWQCWKSSFKHCAKSYGFSPKPANSFGQSAPNLSSESQLVHGTISDWLALSHDTLCGRGWAWACACTYDCHSKISLSSVSKSSLTASYFCLTVSNLLSLHVQLPQTKVYCVLRATGETWWTRQRGVGKLRQWQRS